MQCSTKQAALPVARGVLASRAPNPSVFRTLLDVSLLWRDDSGVNKSFIKQTVVLQLGTETELLDSSIDAKALNGKQPSDVERRTVPVYPLWPKPEAREDPSGNLLLDSSTCLLLQGSFLLAKGEPYFSAIHRLQAVKISIPYPSWVLPLFLSIGPLCSCNWIYATPTIWSASGRGMNGMTPSYGKWSSFI